MSPESSWGCLRHPSLPAPEPSIPCRCSPPSPRHGVGSRYGGPVPPLKLPPSLCRGPGVSHGGVVPRSRCLSAPSSPSSPSPFPVCAAGRGNNFCLSVFLGPGSSPGAGTAPRRRRHVPGHRLHPAMPRRDAGMMGGWLGHHPVSLRGAFFPKIPGGDGSRSGVFSSPKSQGVADPAPECFFPKKFQGVMGPSSECFLPNNPRE